MAAEILDWEDQLFWSPPRKRKIRLDWLAQAGPVIVPAVDASVSISIGVGVGEEPGEVLQDDVIHVGVRVLGYTNSLAARRYRR